MEKIKIISFTGEHIFIRIVPSSYSDPITVVEEAEALEQGEAVYQIKEGCNYEFLIDEGYILAEISGVVATSKLNKQAGRITPNIFVGTLPINVLSSLTFETVGILRLEVQSVKATYREDYRRMLEEIAEKCTDLLMQHNSPVVQTFTIDLEKDSKTAYQRFAFIKSVIDSDEFESAVHKIITTPTTKWRYALADKPIQSVKRLDRRIIRQLSSSTQRIHLSESHPLKKLITSLPQRVQLTSKEETVDTPENKFIKFALETFLKLCSDFSHLSDGIRIKKEASLLEEKLEQHLNNSLFTNVSNLSAIPLNNPVLQRKEGYREIYRAWILFDLAAKLTWTGGEDVYSGHKRDVAVLYEYWLFFKLIEVVTEVFDIKPPQPEDLLEETSDGFGLKLRQGEYLPIVGISEKGSRKLYVQLSYNRTYKGDQPYPNSGSWSRNLRPDYTLTIWPYGITEDQAEEEELIVHIHFDAKYKVEKFQEIFSDQVQLDEEKKEERKGTYKRADLLKMHAYKDAIRRTAGAYVLYPGDDQPGRKKGFHEIVPGLGAFAIRPSRIDNGVEELKMFLNEVTIHLMNRASQREKMTFKTYETYKNNNGNEVTESLPEAFGDNRNFIPDETYVLVAYYKNAEQLKWIEKAKLYNARAGSDRGSLHLSPKETGAKYLLLHGKEGTKTSNLYKLSDKGPRIFSKDDLIKKGYPSPSQPFYLVYDIAGEPESEFKNMIWDISKLKNYQSSWQSSNPIPTTLTELMRTLIK
ncbi:MAG: hypothetical protein JWQ09_664 [Segetibacter sp.]|nr:hypothetical protein [Segetibacter sp.]